MNGFTNNRWLSVITLLLLTANIVTLALLWTHKRNDKPDRLPPPPSGQVFEFLTHELKLDSIQQEAYKKLRDEHQAVQQPMHDSIRNAKDAFFALLKQDNIPDTMLQAYARKIGDMEQQQNLLTFRHFQKLRALCTAEQQKKFDILIQDVLRHLGPQRPQGPPPPDGRKEGDRPGGRNRMPPPPNPEDQPPPQQ